MCKIIFVIDSAWEYNHLKIVSSKRRIYDMNYIEAYLSMN